MSGEDNSIDEEENIFNINDVLTDVFFATKALAEEKGIELIYEMGVNTPRHMRGDSKTLTSLLTKLLTIVFDHTDKKDTVLVLTSPEDFFYEEFVSFHIKETLLSNENIYLLFKTDLRQKIESLDAKVMTGAEESTDIHLRIPFKNVELGFRRHYRLPDKAIVGRNVLLLCANAQTAQSIKKMFEYFHYKVNLDVEQLQKENLHTYDLMIVSEKLPNEIIKNAMYHIQRIATLKYVLLKEAKENNSEETDTEHFIKPITQQKVFDLIVSIFKDELDSEQHAVIQDIDKPIET